MPLNFLSINFEQPKNSLGEGFRPLNTFFSVRRTSAFVPSAFIAWPHFLAVPFAFILLFLLLITHFSQENYAHILFIIPRAALLSQILFLIHESMKMELTLD